MEDAGIELVLGIVAGHTTPLFEALCDHPRIRTILVKQEILASLAANAYGRLTGKPAVIMGEGEFILSTGTQGLIESLLGSSPLVVLTEMYDGGRLSHHGYYHSGAAEPGSYDARAALEAICKRVFVSLYPAQAVQHTQLAVKHAVEGDPGPVAVIYHSAAFEGVVGPSSFPRLYRASGYISKCSRGVDDQVLRVVVESLQRSERPIILAGNGVRVGQACASLERLARAIDAPVTTTQGGKGVFSEFDPLAAGPMGEWGWEKANALLGEADLVLAVGTKLSPIDTVDEIPTLVDPTRQVLIQIDSEPLNAGWTFPIDHVLVGQADFVMDKIADAYQDAGPAARPVNAADRVALAGVEHGEPETPEHFSDDVPLYPQRVVRLVQETWPENGIVTTDAGESRAFMLRWYRNRFPGGYLVPHGGGGMGYAIGAALGAKLAYPDHPVLATCGDGGFAMTMNGLMNALQENLPITVVIFNNRALGWPLHVMPEGKQRYFEIEDFDYAAIARAMGCEGVRTESSDQLRAALEKARESSVPYVIDVPIRIATSFRDATATVATLEREKPWHGASE
jgi:acetolactate synthase-1/2/3 large subunit